VCTAPNRRQEGDARHFPERQRPSCSVRVDVLSPRCRASRGCGTDVGSAMRRHTP
jgi:hypothetical protein